MNGKSKSSRLVSLSIGAAVFLGLTAAVLAGRQSGPADAVPSPVANTVNTPAGVLSIGERERSVLLLAPLDLVESDLPPMAVAGVPLETVRAADARALKDALSPEVGAVIVHAGAIDDADWAWMQERFRSGLVIAALDVHMGRLLDLLYPASEPLLRAESSFGWTRNQPGFPTTRHFYSIIVVGEGCLSAVTTEWEWSDPAFPPQLFAEHLASAMECLVPGSGVGP